VTAPILPTAQFAKYLNLPMRHCLLQAADSHLRCNPEHRLTTDRLMVAAKDFKYQVIILTRKCLGYARVAGGIDEVQIGALAHQFAGKVELSSINGFHQRSLLSPYNCRGHGLLLPPVHRNSLKSFNQTAIGE